MKVLKFGGSSVGDTERIARVIDILEDYNSKNEKIEVVFSAFGGMTDQLIALSNSALKRETAYLDLLSAIRSRHIEVFENLVTHKNKNEVLLHITSHFDELSDILKGVYLLKELTPRILDSILSYGERLSAYIISEVMKSRKIECEYLNATTLIKTDSNFGNAHVNYGVTNSNISKYFKAHPKMQCITGFIASNETGEITTLGRGGSDFTASIIGSALKVKEIEIWTDVDGILTADPRKVKSAIPLRAVTYQEAMEMSFFGAKVIYPPTMQPAYENNIKIRIRNTFHPDFKGTVILQKELDIKFNAKGISSVDNITLLRISGSGLFGNEKISSRIFNALAEEEVKTLLLTQGSSGLSICIAVLPDDGEKSKKAIENELRIEIIDGRVSEITAEENLSIIAVVGENMRHTPGISGRVFEALGKNGVNIIAIAQGSSELNISCVIKNEELSKALNVLHDSLFLAERKVFNIFLVGTGLVGKALLQYLDDRKEFLKDERSIEIRVIGLANSKKMYFDIQGIEIGKWSEILEQSKSKSDMTKFVAEMQKLNLANSIFIDCTANEAAISYYESILGSNISITTPNKIANTKNLEFYKKLRAVAHKKNVKFLYSTNVGAGLPIISTIKDLVSAGDKVYKIEGVLSGTLSYLFNTFNSEKKFSEIVKTAKEKGYTEPNPLEDLNGLDVARKLLILIREIGIDFELSDIKVESLVHQSKNQSSEKNFVKILQELDSEYEEKRIKAEKNNHALRYIAKYEDGKATVKLMEVDPDHSFYNLQGVDNVVAIKTSNYFDQPMIIRGKGAGASFTASGIFADILRITDYLA